MMSDKLRAAAQAALEELIASESNAWNVINDIEAALAEQTVQKSLTVAEQEPVTHPFEDASVISALSWAATLIEQEYPVGHNGADSWLMNYSDKHGEHIRRSDHREWEKVHGRWKPKAASPRREWVGLTGPEVDEAYGSVSDKEWAIGGLADARVFFCAIESMLREKNT